MAERVRVRGRPKTFTLPERREIKKIAKSKPAEQGLPFSTWNLAKPADFLVAEGVADDISHEGLRVLLHEELTYANPCSSAYKPNFTTRVLSASGLCDCRHRPWQKAVVNQV
ncbi:hypothetical protein OG510_21305 [Streptomyces sp. NBC_01089]|nr:hypothetical protein OG510_21305 [Streptomyces sp. NBC_01089]